MPSPPPMEIEMTSTPSLTAASKAARMSESKQPDDALRDSRGVPGHAGLEGVAARGGGRGVGAVAVGVARGSEFDGVVDRVERAGARAHLVAFGEESCADEFAVAVSGRESFSGLAGPFPAAGDGAEVRVGEAAALGPDAGVEDSDDDVGAVVGFGPEAALVAEAEELRGASGVELAAAVFEDGQHGGVPAYGRDLLAREHRGEAAENGVVHVEDAGFLGELGGVPVVVGGEHGGLGLGIHAEDEGLGSFIRGSSGKENEEEKDGES
ncbi:hypothetical protein E2542_SST10567 [Spatholobus suberectus]|nr:hypothetical protein E2542_SST10567 [Spatholobus suberectus]